MTDPLFRKRGEHMATEKKQPDPEVDEDEPTEEEIERQRRSRPDWKHPDDGTELSEPDRKF
jgi:hypothetical protein